MKESIDEFDKLIASSAEEILYQNILKRVKDHRSKIELEKLHLRTNHFFWIKRGSIAFLSAIIILTIVKVAQLKETLLFNGPNENIAAVDSEARNWTGMGLCDTVTYAQEEHVLCETFCRFTQGFGGNESGKDSTGLSKGEILSNLVTPDNPIVIGLPGRSLTIQTNDCILKLVPDCSPSMKFQNNLGDLVLDQEKCNPYSTPTNNSSLLACATEAQILAAYNTWIGGFSNAGGCNALPAAARTLPTFAFGGPVVLTYSYSVTDDCVTKISSSKFCVSVQSSLSLICPKEAPVLAAHNTWISEFSNMGRCNQQTPKAVLLFQLMIMEMKLIRPTIIQRRNKP